MKEILCRREECGNDFLPKLQTCGRLLQHQQAHVNIWKLILHVPPKWHRMTRRSPRFRDDPAREETACLNGGKTHFARRFLEWKSDWRLCKNTSKRKTSGLIIPKCMEEKLRWWPRMTIKSTRFDLSWFTNIFCFRGRVVRLSYIFLAASVWRTSESPGVRCDACFGWRRSSSYCQVERIPARCSSSGRTNARQDWLWGNFAQLAALISCLQHILFHPGVCRLAERVSWRSPYNHDQCKHRWSKYSARIAGIKSVICRIGLNHPTVDIVQVGANDYIKKPFSRAEVCIDLSLTDEPSALNIESFSAADCAHRDAN